MNADPVQSVNDLHVFQTVPVSTDINKNQNDKTQGINDFMIITPIHVPFPFLLLNVHITLINFFAMKIMVVIPFPF